MRFILSKIEEWQSYPYRSQHVHHKMSLFHSKYFHGDCVDGVNLFHYTCDPGFTGELCQTNIDDCVGVTCSGNGVCVDGVNSFTCQCIAISSVGSSAVKVKCKFL